MNISDEECSIGIPECLKDKPVKSPDCTEEPEIPWIDLGEYDFEEIAKRFALTYKDFFGKKDEGFVEIIGNNNAWNF